MSKVFGIGLPRTGTASLSEALTILGYKTRHYPKYVARASKFDALVDTPICNSFELLDNQFPGSLFILTTRELHKWLSSCQMASKRFCWSSMKPDGRCGPEVYQSHIGIFGTVAYDRTMFIDGYANHAKRVLEYFNDRSDLLVYDIRDGWHPLCRFLGLEEPNMSFPHRNKS